MRGKERGKRRKEGREKKGRGKRKEWGKKK